MKQNLLLPHGFQRIGWAILFPALTLGMAFILKNWEYPGVGILDNSTTKVLNNVVLIGITFGGVLVACSREKVEDEMIDRLRLNALLTAFYVNYALLIVACLTVYDDKFLNVMLYNLFTMLLLFLAVFRYRLWRLRKQVCNEE